MQYPYLERKSDSPRSVLGLFDVTARPFVVDDILTLSVPMKRFQQMMDNMNESFLTTKSWRRVQTRIAKAYLREVQSEGEAHA
jgi:hypothetical protein